MKECPKEKFIQIPNDLFEAISSLGLGKSQGKIVDLILRYTYGVTIKIDGKRYHNTETAELKQADIARILKFDATHVREVLDFLVSRGVIIWDREYDRFKINEVLPEMHGYKDPEHTEMLGKNIRKLKAERDDNRNNKLTESVTADKGIHPLPSQKILPKYSKDIINTTNTSDAVKKTLLKYLEGVDSIKNPSAYLEKIISTYGEGCLRKLLNLELRQWYEHLDHWKKEGKL